ncbi:MAG: AAA family ATPase, partial [Proteobacteria bacterium]|nr:AAA family ATPase [Pseudomonadota bacterium]
MRIKHVEISNFRGIKSLSWRVKGDFNCIIGPGDTCKTTILTALDYALSPRSFLAFDDSDFFNQDISQDIVIQVTLSDWDETQDDIRRFFQESKFAQHKCGISDTGPLPEPGPDGQVAISISLRVDESLEPRWSVVRGRDEEEDQDRKPIYAADRAVLGLSRIDIFSDFHFTWGRNTILTRLSADSEGNLNTVLSALARDMRESDISHHESIQECQTIADTIKADAQNAGVILASLSPKIDIQRQSVSTGALSLHEDNVPLRNKGSGTKKLIGAAMQMKLHGGKNISLIDELEVGLEPHRIRGLIYKLKNSNQQIFATTHSPVVIRELDVADNELYVCKRNAAGIVNLESLTVVPEIQGQVRANAEAFLGSKIVGCEGSTEIGCLRAYDVYRFNKDDPPVWSLATSYLNCGGASRIKPVCDQLLILGYHTAVLCDNDAPIHLTATDIQNLQGAGAHICQWDNDNSTEHQLFTDLPWQNIPALLQTICNCHDTLEHATVIDNITNEPRVQTQNLGNDPTVWQESPILRQIMGDLANTGKWIKRIDYAEKVFTFALPLLTDTSVIKIRLDALWSWI